MASLRQVQPVALSRACARNLELMPRSQATDLRRILNILPTWAAEPLEEFIEQLDREELAAIHDFGGVADYCEEPDSHKTQSSYQSSYLEDDGSGSAAAAPEQPVRDAVERDGVSSLQLSSTSAEPGEEHEPHCSQQRADSTQLDSRECHECYLDGEPDTWRGVPVGDDAR